MLKDVKGLENWPDMEMIWKNLILIKRISSQTDLSYKKSKVLGLLLDCHLAAKTAK